MFERFKEDIETSFAFSQGVLSTEDIETIFEEENIPLTEDALGRFFGNIFILEEAVSETAMEQLRQYIKNDMEG